MKLATDTHKTAHYYTVLRAINDGIVGIPLSADRKYFMSLEGCIADLLCNSVCIVKVAERASLIHVRAFEVLNTLTDSRNVLSFKFKANST